MITDDDRWRESILIELASNRTRAAAALLEMAMSQADRGWVESTLRDTLVHSSDPQLRGLAATCFGHLARLRGGLEPASLELLGRLKGDQQVEARIKDALDDVAVFIGRSDADGGSM